MESASLSQTAYDLKGAQDFFRLSLQAVNDFGTEIATLRSIASLSFLRGDPESGRRDFQAALNIFQKYQGYDAYTIASTQHQTELAWALAEATNGARSLVEAHLQAAERTIAELPISPGVSNLRGQITQARLQYERAGILQHGREIEAMLHQGAATSPEGLRGLWHVNYPGAIVQNGSSGKPHIRRASLLVMSPPGAAFAQFTKDVIEDHVLIQREMGTVSVPDADTVRLEWGSAFRNGPGGPYPVVGFSVVTVDKDGVLRGQDFVAGLPAQEWIATRGLGE